MNLAQSLVDAISLGAVYALAALGCGLIFGIMRLVNFAHGELIMAAGHTLDALSGEPLWLRIGTALVVAVVPALLLERGVFCTLRGAAPATLLIASFAVSHLLQLPARPAERAPVPPRRPGAGVSGALQLCRALGTFVVLAAALVAVTALPVSASAGLGVALAGVVALLIGVPRERLVAFVLSALVVGLGGVLYAYLLGTVTAGTFHLDLTFVTLAMLVVGGMLWLTGAVVGTALVSVANEALRMIERGTTILGIPLDAPPGLQKIGLSLLLLVLLLRPAGLVGDREAGWPGGGAARSPEPGTNAQAAE